MVNVAYFDTSALLKQYLLDVMAITLETARQLVKHRPLRAYDAV